MKTTQSHVVIPFLDLADMTKAAALDAQAQKTGAGAPVVLLMDNGSYPRERESVQRWASDQQSNGNLTFWLPAYNHALGELWNRALSFCWMLGAEDALVLNNDTRISPWTYQYLRKSMHLSNALFVSAVNVTEEQWQEARDLGPDPLCLLGSTGGPDYSCFLISKTCHQRFPFDPKLTYRGDLDHHRRIMLAGEGKRIFSIPLPYRHLGSKTIHRSPEAYAQHCLKDQLQGAYYKEKWGGGPNEETFASPFAVMESPGMTTPELQRRGRG